MGTQVAPKKTAASSADGADGGAIVALVDDLLGRALDARASDVHFEPVDKPPGGLLVRVRVDGLLHDSELLPRTAVQGVIGRLKVLAGLLTYRVDIPQEGSVRLARQHPAGDPVELRVATFPTVRGERAVVRVFAVQPEVRDLAGLGLEPAQIRRLRLAVSAPAGMILVTGPAGAGKTTTLYSLVRYVRETDPGRSVVTVEDPVEQRIDRVTQIQINPHGELSYEVCMRSLLRQDPQVLLIGEIRDARTAGAALEAALTGHLILTTMHSGDPAEAVLRLLEMGLPPYQVVSAVTAVCSQRLLRRCMPANLAHGGGPDTGPPGKYHGRVACAHLVEIDEEFRSLILEQPTASRLRSAMQRQQPDLHAAAARLVVAGVTDVEEVRRVLGDGECCPSRDARPAR